MKPSTVINRKTKACDPMPKPYSPSFPRLQDANQRHMFSTKRFLDYDQKFSQVVQDQSATALSVSNRKLSHGPASISFAARFTVSNDSVFRDIARSSERIRMHYWCMGILIAKFSQSLGAQAFSLFKNSGSGFKTGPKGYL